MIQVPIARRRLAIFGCVVDKETGQPVEQAEVAIISMPDRFQKTVELVNASRNRGAIRDDRPDIKRAGPDGFFHFTALPEGTYTLRASARCLGARYTIAEQTVKVARMDGETKPEPVRLALQPTTIKGRVTGPGNKPAVLLAEVRIKGSNERTYSDIQGNYVLSAVEPGTRTVLAKAQGYKPGTLQVKVDGPGDVKAADFALVREQG